jgi:hypothetical protein
MRWPYSTRIHVGETRFRAATDEKDGLFREGNLGAESL